MAFEQSGEDNLLVFFVLLLAVLAVLLIVQPVFVVDLMRPVLDAVGLSRVWQFLVENGFLVFQEFGLLLLTLLIFYFWVVIWQKKPSEQKKK